MGQKTKCKSFLSIVLSLAMVLCFTPAAFGESAVKDQASQLDANSQVEAANSAEDTIGVVEKTDGNTALSGSTAIDGDSILTSVDESTNAVDVAAQDDQSVNAQDAQIMALSNSGQLYSTDFNQQDETTQVKVSVPNLQYLISGSRADKVVVRATMNYGGVITRDISSENSLSDLTTDDPSFLMDFTTYGKFTVTTTFYKNGVVVSEESQTFGVVASEYNIAPVSATLPVTFFSLSLFEAGNTKGTQEGDIRHNAEGDLIPTIMLMERPSAYDWDELPDGVYSIPYLTEDDAETQPASFGEASDKFRSRAAAMQAYVGDLYEMNPSATFHLYLVDYYLGLIQTCLYANGIPQSQYTITIMSDGTFSYNEFSSVYNGTSESANQAIESDLENEWNTLKEYAYENGTTQDGFELWSNQYLYAVLQCEDNVEWWLARPALLTTSNDDGAFGKAVQSNTKIKRIFINNKLANLTTDEQAEFKALYNFSDSYFADAEQSGKKVMLFIGTTVGGENGSFPDYAKFTQVLYGDEYEYYYKGHPGSPTDMYPSKQAELESLGITDVDSSVAAELIIFFNPGIYLSGYSSSTFASVDNGKNVLFRETKAAAQTDGSNVANMQYFVSPIGDDTAQAIKDLSNSGRGNYLVEFADSILETADYDIALWNPETEIISYYKDDGTGGYTFVQQQGGSGGALVDDGAYTITGSASQKTVDISGASRDNMANAQIWTDNTTPAQRFYFESDGQGYYTIKNVNSGKVLDVAGASTEPGTNVWQYESNGSDAQKWSLVSYDDGTYGLVSKCNGLYLDVAANGTGNGSNLQVYTGNGTQAQKFNLNLMKEVVASAAYNVSSSLNAAKALDVEGGSLEDSANIQLYDANGSSAQVFNFQYDASTGYYTIINRGSGKALDVDGASALSGANVQQYDSNGTYAQKWTIELNGSTICIRTATSGCCLDVSGASTENGANIQVWDKNGTAAQAMVLNAT